MKYDEERKTKLIPKEEDSLMISENRKSYKNVRRFNTSKINNGKQRYQYISQMIYFLENRSFDSVYCDLEILPILFKNDKNYKELI